MTRRLVTWPLRTRYRPVRLPVQTVRWCLRKSNTASVAKHRDLPSPVGKETKTSLHSRNSRTALSWSLVAAAYPRVRKACLMASFTSSTATPLTSSLGISRIDARRTPLVITRSDASFSGNLIGQNDIVLQCQAFRLNVPDHLSSPIKDGGRKWTGDETTAVSHNTNGGNLVLIWKPRTRDLNSSRNLTRKVFSLFLFGDYK